MSSEDRASLFKIILLVNNETRAVFASLEKYGTVVSIEDYINNKAYPNLAIDSEQYKDYTLVDFYQTGNKCTMLETLYIITQKCTAKKKSLNEIEGMKTFMEKNGLSWKIYEIRSNTEENLLIKKYVKCFPVKKKTEYIEMFDREHMVEQLKYDYTL